MKCQAVVNGKVCRKGKASLEWFMGSRPMYYCMGYVDKMTDDLIPECESCSRHVNKAQEDLDQYTGRASNEP